MKNQQYQYLCLVEELRKRLQDGELQSGSAIPSEAELAKALSLSKREVRPLLKNLEIAGILSGSRDGTYTLAKEMSDSMRELMHVMFLVQNISPFEVCQMHRWLIRASGNRLMECVTQGIWGICSAQINLILSDGTEELRKVQASIHERFYKSFLIGDLRMGLDAVREHYDTIEQALGEQSLYDLGTHIA